ncbi:hypothetical protein Sjap_003841 [Stephania japonica]|uniref:Transmembrane protein n=1 Tax=Stephania japonica TaxID=461633 RepID=A0AAP0KPQ3_9MAGN
MLPNPNLISCNFSTCSSLLIKTQITRHSNQPTLNAQKSKLSFLKTLNPPCTISSIPPLFHRRIGLQICHNSFDSVEESQDPDVNKLGSGNGGDGGDWTTSILLFGLWGALMYYVFLLTPNQTPIRDMYFLEKLLNLKGDDGFRMNEVLVSLWYIMGLWPVVYSMLLIPSGRSLNLQLKRQSYCLAISRDFIFWWCICSSSIFCSLETTIASCRRSRAQEMASKCFGIKSYCLDVDWCRTIINCICRSC